MLLCAKQVPLFFGERSEAARSYGTGGARRRTNPFVVASDNYCRFENPLIFSSFRSIGVYTRDVEGT